MGLLARSCSWAMKTARMRAFSTYATRWYVVVLKEKIVEVQSRHADEDALLPRKVGP